MSRRLNPPGDRGASSNSGILPIAKSTPSQIDAWELPGHGEPYDDCGTWRARGCLNVEKHKGMTLDGQVIEGKAFVRWYRRACLRAECPTCYEKWAGKEAHKIAHRLKAWKGKGQVIHLIVSPPWLVVEKAGSYEALRKEAYKVAREVGFLGGAVVYHPFRRKCAECGSFIKEGFKNCFVCKSKRIEWIFSPHFHMMGFGWIQKVKEGYARHGWIAKNAGTRKSVIGTAQYLLSHAGVHPKKHTTTWFGFLSYNKLKVPPMEREKEVCPACGSQLRPLKYCGSWNPPEMEGDYWLDPERWEYKVLRKKKEFVVAEDPDWLRRLFPEVPMYPIDDWVRR